MTEMARRDLRLGRLKSTADMRTTERTDFRELANLAACDRTAEPERRPRNTEMRDVSEPPPMTFFAVRNRTPRGKPVI